MNQINAIEGHYDAVVIGSGLGGLGAAYELAKSGKKTILLEQHNLPGGFATSFVRGRFEFEPSLHELSGAGYLKNRVGIRKYLEDEGFDISYASVPEAYRLILTDKNINLRVPFGVEAFIDTIVAHSPDSGELMTRYMELCKNVTDAADYLGKAGKKIDKKLLFKKYGDFLRTTPYAMKEVADVMEIPQDVKDILYGYWCYLGLPESRFSFMIWSAMLYSYIENGAAVPVMRSHEISQAFIDKIESLGGRVEMNTRVDKIHVENGKVSGVQTNQGDKIQTEHIVCNASPTLAYNRLVYPQSAVPKMAYRNVNARGQGPAGFVVYLGLDASTEELGLTDYGYLISADMDTEKIYKGLDKAQLTGMQASVCLNNAVPDCSPEGTTILSMTTLYHSEAWADVQPKDYYRLKNKIASDMIGQFEQATGVSLRGHIEEMEVATPQTFARYTGTHFGQIYAYDVDPWDSIIPRAMTADNEVYISGLRFGNGYTYRAHGYGGAMMGGVKAARDTINEMEAADGNHY